jgi:hypothetical protein
MEVVETVRLAADAEASRIVTAMIIAYIVNGGGCNGEVAAVAVASKIVTVIVTAYICS